MGAVFGNGNKPGVAGTGQQQFDTYGTSGAEEKDMRNAYYKEDQYNQTRDNLNQRQNQIDNRQAPTSQAAQANLNDLYKASLQNANVSYAQGVNLAPAQLAQNQNIGAANTAQGVNLGSAAQANAAQLNSQDAQFRNNQVALSNALTSQMNGNGPSLAASQYQQAAEQNLANQLGAAATLGGGNASLGARQLAQNAALQGQQTARDVSNIRLQEQLAAQQQLAGVSSTGRDQDINLAAQNAQLQQQAALANQSAQNAYGLQQGQMSLQNNQFNASLLNDRQYQQAQLNQQTALANQQYQNQFALQQGQMSLQNNQFNSSAQNAAYLQNAQLNAANQMQYSSQYNQQLGQNTQNQQQTNLANQQAYLQNQQMNDQMSQFYQQSVMDQYAQEQQAQMAYQQAMLAQNMQQNQLQQAAYEAARQGQSSLFGSVLGAAGSIAGGAAMSDKEVKTSISRADDKIKEYLESLRNGSNGAAFVGEGYPTSGNYINSGNKELNNYLSHSPAGSKSLSDKSEKDKMQEENDRMKSIIQGLVQESTTRSSVPGFAGGLASGVGAGGSLMMNLNQAKLMKQQMANQAPTNTSSLSDNKIYSGESDMGANIQTGIGDNQPKVQPNQPAPNMSSHSPAGSKNLGMYAPQTSSSQKFGQPIGLNASQMRGANAVKILGGSQNGNMSPTTYDKRMAGYGMDVRGTAANMSDAATAYTSNPNNFSDYPGMGVSGPAASGKPNMMSRISDESQKELSSDAKIKEYLDNLHPYDYNYKEPDLPGRGHGRYVSPMAQEFEKSELGKTAVQQTSQGKMVDYGKLLGTMAAADAYLNERLNKIEGKKGKPPITSAEKHKK